MDTLNYDELITKIAKVNLNESNLDKFYTLPDYSKKCIVIVNNMYGESENWDLIIEPSAGNGSFLNQIITDNKIGIDIAPEHPDIIKKDFFDYSPFDKKFDKKFDKNFKDNKKRILVIGNPPFGRVCSNAIKFFNHAAKWATVIAFIIPRTFRRVSVQNKLNEMFHLVYDEETPTKPCCFSPKMMVKCCFQIWERKTTPRLKVVLSTKHIDWDFLPFGPNDGNGQPTPPDGADFALRAYGGKIGDIKIEMADLRPKSWHWIKSKIDKNILMDNFKKLDYSNSLNTARQNSMGRGELVQLYTLALSNIIDSET